MIEGCKWTLTCHPSRCLENNSAESYVDYGGPVQELSRENNIGNWARECSCDILRGKKNNKKYCLFSVHVLRTFLRLNLKVSLGEEY